VNFKEEFIYVFEGQMQRFQNQSIFFLQVGNVTYKLYVIHRWFVAYLKTLFNDSDYSIEKSKAVPLHAMVALGGRRGIAPTHS
jgi:hypothetical protein